MKATQLRIGNYVNVPGLFTESDIVGIVESISKDEIITDRCEANILLFKPIELTEEWLINFGFVPKTKNTNILHFTIKPNLWLKSNFYSDCFTCELMCKDLSIYYIDYVHQLQNLYFALTGEELTIKK